MTAVIGPRLAVPSPGRECERGLVAARAEPRPPGGTEHSTIATPVWRSYCRLRNKPGNAPARAGR